MLPKDHPEFNLEEGVVMLVDKPLHWTSFDVVNKLRYSVKHAFGLKKVKVGHAGTLDPLATGLLIVCAGKATKRIDTIQADDKRYTGTITLGARTPSYDLETDPVPVANPASLTLEDVQRAADSFVGEIKQIPPAFSAKKMDGETAYNLARAGVEVKMREAIVRVNAFEITEKDGDQYRFEVTCSKGTYIRSLAHDLGQKLEVGGYLSSLRRTQSGVLSIEDAKQVDKWVEYIRQLPKIQM